MGGEEKRQADIARETGADKGLVSRWFSGTVPKPDYLKKLADLFGTSVHGLFQHPVDDEISRFFRDKTEEEKVLALEMLNLWSKRIVRNDTNASVELPKPTEQPASPRGGGTIQSNKYRVLHDKIRRDV